jgi:hypothetical protein
MTKYPDVQTGDWIKPGIYMALCVVVVIAGALTLLPAFWYAYAILVAAALYLLVRWHSRYYAYRCPNCGNEYTVGIITDFINPHGFSGGLTPWKYLRCPKCHQRSKNIAVRNRSL